MTRKVISWLLVILWMVLIFYLSQQPATESNSLSTGITERIVAIIERLTSDIDFDVSNFNHIIRKNAHFFAYLILGVCV
ncbi:MAG: VanZ family protein [Clostridiales bacterium]|nr:VanZ family protein [Clostridiales bacterium]